MNKIFTTLHYTTLFKNEKYASCLVVPASSVFISLQQTMLTLPRTAGQLVWNEERGVGADGRGVVVVVMLPLLNRLLQLRQNWQPVSVLQ